MVLLLKELTSLQNVYFSSQTILNNNYFHWILLIIVTIKQGKSLLKFYKIHEFLLVLSIFSVLYHFFNIWDTLIRTIKYSKLTKEMCAHYIEFHVKSFERYSVAVILNDLIVNPIIWLKKKFILTFDSWITGVL